MSEFAKRLAQYDLTPEELFRKQELDNKEVAMMIQCICLLIDGRTQKNIVEQQGIETSVFKERLDNVKQLLISKNISYDKIIEPSYIQSELSQEEIGTTFEQFVNLFNLVKQRKGYIQPWIPTENQTKLFQLMVTTHTTINEQAQELFPLEKIEIGNRIFSSVSNDRRKILEGVLIIFQRVHLKSPLTIEENLLLLTRLEKLYINNVSPSRRNSYIPKYSQRV